MIFCKIKTTLKAEKQFLQLKQHDDISRNKEKDGTINIRRRETFRNLLIVQLQSLLDICCQSGRLTGSIATLPGREEDASGF